MICSCRTGGSARANHEEREILIISITQGGASLALGYYLSPLRGLPSTRGHVALHWSTNRPGSQRVVGPEDIALFQSASTCPRAAGGNRPRSALKCPHLAKTIATGTQPSGRRVFECSCAWKLSRNYAVGMNGERSRLGCELIGRPRPVRTFGGETPRELAGEDACATVCFAQR